MESPIIFIQKSLASLYLISNYRKRFIFSKNDSSNMLENLFFRIFHYLKKQPYLDINLILQKNKLIYDYWVDHFPKLSTSINNIPFLKANSSTLYR